MKRNGLTSPGMVGIRNREPTGGSTILLNSRGPPVAVYAGRRGRGSNFAEVERWDTGFRRDLIQRVAIRR